MRLPEGGFAAGANARSVFDQQVLGAGTMVRRVALRDAGPRVAGAAVSHGLPRPPMAPADGRARGAAGPVGGGPAMGQGPEIERVIMRETPPAGLTGREAAALADALGPAIDASARAAEEGVSCPRVGRAALDQARAARDFLASFASVARPDERTERLSAGDLAALEDVLACEAAYRQVSEARAQRSAAIVVGGLVIGGIALVVLT